MNVFFLSTYLYFRLLCVILLISDYLTCEFHTLVHVLGVSREQQSLFMHFLKSNVKKRKEMFFDKSWRFLKLKPIPCKSQISESVLLFLRSWILNFKKFFLFLLRVCNANSYVPEHVSYYFQSSKYESCHVYWPRTKSLSKYLPVAEYVIAKNSVNI